jgi:twitching motility protein PilT
LVPKQAGGRLLVTELLGSNLRSREAIALGENENRRLSDVIEAGSTSGWHTFEQSLIKAYEEKQITEETALLYCVNRNQMRQRVDVVNKRRDAAPGASSLKMKHVEEAPKPRPMAPPMAPVQAPPAAMQPLQANPTAGVPAQPRPTAPAQTVVSSIPLQMKP